MYLEDTNGKFSQETPITCACQRHITLHHSRSRPRHTGTAGFSPLFRSVIRHSITACPCINLVRLDAIDSLKINSRFPPRLSRCVTFQFRAASMKRCKAACSTRLEKVPAVSPTFAFLCSTFDSSRPQLFAFGFCFLYFGINPDCILQP